MIAVLGRKAVLASCNGSRVVPINDARALGWRYDAGTSAWSLGYCSFASHANFVAQL